MSNATVRVLDATGKVAASGKPVAANTGTYGPITLAGGGPYRVEACGTLAGRQRCVWGATTTGGSLNLTPLTSVLTVLASGQSPEGLMTGAVQGLADADLAAAQTQLRTAIAPALTDAGLAANFDFLLGDVTPGSHTGYDRLLDTLQITLGQDGSAAFAQITPKLGTGRVYLQSGSSAQGSLTLDAKAATLSLTGYDTLFSAMLTATASNNSCQSGLAPLFDPAARVSLGTVTQTGAQAVQLLCLNLAGVLGPENLFGGKLLRPDLGRCDFSGADPICRVGPLMWQTPTGDLRVLGVEQTVVQHVSGWQFLGNRLDLQASATARTVLARRVDASASDALYRYLDVAIPAVSGLQCASVSQKDSNGADVLLGYYKPSSGGGSYLSLWSLSLTNGAPSLDPNSGATLGADLIGLPLPSTNDGDAAVRNLVRNGASLQLKLYSDAACTASYSGPGGDTISIDLQGLPALSLAALRGQPWPSLAAPTNAALAALKGSSGAKATLAASWTVARAGDSLNAAQLCTDIACSVPVAQLGLSATAVSASLSGTLTATLVASDFKQLRLIGRAPDGGILQADYQSCASLPAASVCK